LKQIRQHLLHADIGAFQHARPHGFEDISGAPPPFAERAAPPRRVGRRLPLNIDALQLSCAGEPPGAPLRSTPGISVTSCYGQLRGNAADWRALQWRPHGDGA
jgi:hypothetical protein